MFIVMIRGLICALCLLCSAALAAPAFNAASSNAVDDDTVSVSHAAAGSNRYAVVCAFQAVDHTISSISYGAQTPTLLGSIGRLSVYGLVAPATGSQTVTATSDTSGGFVLGVLSYTGVNQSTPTGTVVTDTNSELASISATVSSATGNLVVDCAMMIQTAMAADGTQTERLSLDDPGVGFFSLGMSEKTGASSVTMTWTASETFGDNLIVAVPLVASASTGGALLLRRRRG